MALNGMIFDLDYRKDGLKNESKFMDSANRFNSRKYPSLVNMAIVTKEFTKLLHQELERIIRPVFENMTTKECTQFLKGIGPALQDDPHIFTRMWDGKSSSKLLRRGSISRGS